jgi:hypothetical protein
VSDDALVMRGLLWMLFAIGTYGAVESAISHYRHHYPTGIRSDAVCWVVFFFIVLVLDRVIATLL